MKEYTVLAAFRYPVNGYIQWVTPDTHITIQLPIVAGDELERQLKVKKVSK